MLTTVGTTCPTTASNVYPWGKVCAPGGVMRSSRAHWGQARYVQLGVGEEVCCVMDAVRAARIKDSIIVQQY